MHVLAKYGDHVVLDVRTDDEWQDVHIEGAIHKPISDLIHNGIDLDKHRHITAVCGSGYRSNIAGSFLKSLGYEHVFSLIGGMTAWNAVSRSPGGCWKPVATGVCAYIASRWGARAAWQSSPGP